MSRNIASEISGSIDRNDQILHAQLATHTDSSPTLIAEMREHWQARHRLDGLAMGLAALAARHGDDGQIPVDEIRALLKAVDR